MCGGKLWCVSEYLAYCDTAYRMREVFKASPVTDVGESCGGRMIELLEAIQDSIN